MGNAHRVQNGRGQPEKKNQENKNENVRDQLCLIVMRTTDPDLPKVLEHVSVKKTGWTFGTWDAAKL